ncbi:MAG: PKD domain-containing protein [Saprospiraceae bacterium]|nr:PKD domain-containing protein [Saprospiraceae bacterium]
MGEPAMNKPVRGEILFSPEGNKMARFNPKDDLRLFDFDRCTGALSNPRFVPIQDNADIEIYAGLAWSADSRYLYAAEVQKLLQFDTWAPDLAGSMTLIANAEPPLCPLSGTIGFMELGPDGMIYSRPLNGQKCMHRIVHPERAGAACVFQQNYYQFDYPYANMTHYPNFRLGPVDGSPCDTLGIDNHPLAGWRYERSGDLMVDFTSVSWYEPEAWLWDFGDPASGSANSSAERNPVHTFSAPGAWEVCLTVSNIYGSDTKCKTVWVNTSGLPPSPDQQQKVLIWPNPTTGMVYWSGAGGQPVDVQVFNTMGQLVADIADAGTEVDLGMLPQGLYFLRLFGKDRLPLAVKPLRIVKP